MTYSDLKRYMLNKEVPNFLIFSGDEREVQLAYIRKISECKEQIVKRIDGVGEAFKTRGLSLLNQSFCYVCTDDMDFQKTESAWADIEEKIGSNTLIYITTKLDKRSKFYNHFESQITVFDYMTEQVLIKHIKEIIPLSTDSCKELINICESDYSRILSEIDKIQTYGKVMTNGGMDEVFHRLVTDGTIYKPPTDAIFDWVNAVLNGKPVLSFRLYEECKEMGEPTLRLLLVLYQGIKRLLQVQSCESKNIAENTGLSQWEVNLVKDYVGIYRTSELVEALRGIRELEVGIKIGQIAEETAVPYAMINILGE